MQVTDPEQVFRTIDENGGGSVLFDEFCVYAAQHNLDLDDDDDFEVTADDLDKLQNARIRISPIKPKRKQRSSTSASITPDRNPGTALDLSQIDWQSLSSKLPSQRTPEQTELRKRLFRQIDENGNGLVSLAELDKGVRDVLQCPEIFQAKPAIARAFHAAKDVKQSRGDNDDDSGADYIEASEFRLFLLFLRQFFEYYVMFCRFDTNGDFKLTQEEFSQAVPLLEK